MSAAAPGSCLSAVTTDWVAWRISRSLPKVSATERALMSTDSWPGCWTPGSFSTRSACPAWPGS